MTKRERGAWRSSFHKGRGLQYGDLVPHVGGWKPGSRPCVVSSVCSGTLITITETTPAESSKQPNGLERSVLPMMKNTAESFNKVSGII
jgi:hypothetical protein